MARNTDKDVDTTPAESDAWMPTTPGETLEGRILDLDVAWSDWRARSRPQDPNGGNYPILIVKTPDNEIVKVHAFRTVLFNEVNKRKPMPGEAISLTYLGEGKPPADGKGNAPILYRLTVHGRSPEKVAQDVYGNLPGAQSPAAQVEPDVPVDTTGLQEEIPF